MAASCFGAAPPSPVPAAAPGLVDALFRRAEKLGVTVRYNAWVRELLREGDTVCGVILSNEDGERENHPRQIGGAGLRRF